LNHPAALIFPHLAWRIRSPTGDLAEYSQNIEIDKHCNCRSCYFATHDDVDYPKEIRDDTP
jgi:hypothetical protein